MVVDSGTDVVAPGSGLLAQRPHQPARPRHPPQSASAAHRHLCHTHRFRCPTPAPSQHHGRLTAQPSRHPPTGPATSTGVEDSLSTLYRLTNNRIGGRSIAGSPILLLATTGRRTGKQRTRPLA